MVSHWAVVGFGSGTVGSFQSKKNDWELDQHRPWNRHEGVEPEYLRDVGNDVLAKTGTLGGSDEQGSNGEEGKRWHCDTCRGGG